MAVVEAVLQTLLALVLLTRDTYYIDSITLEQDKG